MNIIIAAGGTAGHINPALAIADKIKKERPNANITFVGRMEGMEFKLVTKAGYDFCNMEVTGFQRRLTPQNIKRNVVTIKNLVTAKKRANKILNELSPDLVIGTGGYVAGPMVLAAAKRGIKTAIHEQNAFAGVTNKILSRYVDFVFIATEKAAQYMHNPKKCIVTGNPVREDVIHAQKFSARQELSVQDKTVVLSFGGSLGAAAINRAVKDLILYNKSNKNIVHFHAYGSYDEGEFRHFLIENSMDNSDNIKASEYIYDIPKYMAAADIVICRCGALTIAEIACMGKASILIPSPNVAENHQYFNGKVLTDMDAAILIEEKHLNKENIISAFKEIYQNPIKAMNMGENAKKAYNPHCIDIIFDSLNI